MNMDMSTKRIGAVTAVAVVVLVAAWYLALFSPQKSHLAKAHKAQAAAEQQVGSLESQVAGLRALQRQIPADKTKLAAYDNAVPDNPQLASAIRLIQGAANASGVHLSAIGPSNATTASTTGVPTVPVSLTTTGSYSQLMSFISALDSMPRTLVVNGINISGQGASLGGQFNTSIFYAGQPTP